MENEYLKNLYNMRKNDSKQNATNFMSYFQKLNLEEVFKKEIKKNLILLFQPIYSLKDNKITKYETLSRFISEEFGIIPTLETITLLEKLNLIDFFDFLILDKVKEHLSKTDVILSVNISPKTILHNEFIDKILSLKENLSNLELEITEMEEIDSLIFNSKISLLREKGVKITVDDFPIKNSNLQNVVKYNIDGIKIDHSLLTDFKKKSTYKKMVSLLKDLVFEVTAEGIETKEEFEFIKNSGVNYIQGYYIGFPTKKIP